MQLNATQNDMILEFGLIMMVSVSKTEQANPHRSVLQEVFRFRLVKTMEMIVETLQKEKPQLQICNFVFHVWPMTVEI
jgi:hypothetical protein